jgi:hypothetical protein
MRYRALSSDGDFSFGRGGNNFLVNTPETVAQAVKTRLGLITGEWFLDVTEGVPYTTDVLGTGTSESYDLAIQDRVLGTEGVTEILGYVSDVNKETRALSVEIVIDTVYGQATVEKVWQ